MKRLMSMLIVCFIACGLLVSKAQGKQNQSKQTVEADTTATDTTLDVIARLLRKRRHMRLLDFRNQMENQWQRYDQNCRHRNKDSTCCHRFDRYRLQNELHIHGYRQ